VKKKKKKFSGEVGGPEPHHPYQGDAEIGLMKKKSIILRANCTVRIKSKRGVHSENLDVEQTPFHCRGSAFRENSSRSDYEYQKRGVQGRAPSKFKKEGARRMVAKEIKPTVKGKKISRKA